MASGHANRLRRPNTWPHRPTLRRKVFPCQIGAVHTWRISEGCLRRLDSRIRLQIGLRKSIKPVFAW
jgi:hypothetical protein